MATGVVVVASGDEGIVTAFCPAGLIPTGGGAFSANNPNLPDANPPAGVNYAINSSYPFNNGDGTFGWTSSSRTTPRTRRPCRRT